MKYCIKCGAELPDEALFCSNCGSEVKTNTESKAPDQIPNETVVKSAPIDAEVYKKPVCGIISLCLYIFSLALMLIFVFASKLASDTSDMSVVINLAVIIGMLSAFVLCIVSLARKEKRIFAQVTFFALVALLLYICVWSLF